MLFILATLIGVAFLDDPTLAPNTPPVMTGPKWITPPNADELVRFYPVAAVRARLDGAATITCAVSIEGYLNSCRVVAETPAEAGFGLATVQASALWRMAPATRDGVPVPSVVTVPLKWKIASNPAQTQRPAIDRPHWLSPPTGQDLSDLYPPAARRAQIEGFTSVRCVVTIEGYLKDCAVAAETPADAGFGAATIRAATRWRMSPATSNGAPVEGVVTVPVNWRLGR